MTMNQVFATEIVTRIKNNTVSKKDIIVIEHALRLLEAVENVKESQNLIDGELVQKEDLDVLGADLGRRLLQARKAKKLTQESLEKKSKVSQSTISKIEKGSRMISIGEAKSLAKVLGVTPEFLIAGI